MRFFINIFLHLIKENGNLILLGGIVVHIVATLFGWYTLLKQY